MLRLLWKFTAFEALKLTLIDLVEVVCKVFGRKWESNRSVYMCMRVVIFLGKEEVIFSFFLPFFLFEIVDILFLLNK